LAGKRESDPVRVVEIRAVGISPIGGDETEEEEGSIFE